MLLDTSHVSALSTVSTTSIYSPDGFSSRRKQVRGLEIGVHPHYRREMVILDAVAGLRVVWDDFPAAAAVLGVELVEDGASILGRTNVILLE